MRIDADCHLAAPSNGTGIGADELLRRLDQVGVDKAITWPMVSYTRDIAPDNAAIYQARRAHPDRIIPFGGVNPMLGVDVAKDELKRCIERVRGAGRQAQWRAGWLLYRRPAALAATDRDDRRGRAGAGVSLRRQRL